MDNPAAGKCGAAEEVHTLQPHRSVDTPLFSEESMEVVPEADASKIVDKSEDVSGGVTEKGSRVASGSALTDSNAAIAAAAECARAAVVASAVSSMTALVAVSGMSIPPPPFQAQSNSRFTPGSTFNRGIMGRGTRSPASVAASGLAGGVSSFFVGYAPWPKEGPRDVEEEGTSGGNKSTPATSSSRTSTPTPPTPAGCDADRTASSRRRNDGVDSHEGAGESRTEVEKGARASKTRREVQTKKGGGSLSQRPGWKTQCGTIRCSKSASFGFFGNKGKYCVKHKEEGMVNLRRGRCQVSGCPKPPTRVLIGGQKVRFCKEHWPPGMSRQCSHPEGCTRLATHAPPHTARVGQGPVVAATQKVSPPPPRPSALADVAVRLLKGGGASPISAAPEQGVGVSKGGGGAVAGKREDPPASSEVSVVGGVATPDNGGILSITEASGTGFSGAGAVLSAPASSKNASASGGLERGVVEKAGDPDRGGSSMAARGLGASTAAGHAAGLVLPTRCSEHAEPGWVNAFSVDSGCSTTTTGGSATGNGDKSGATDVQAQKSQTDGQQQRSKRRSSLGGGWATGHDDDFLYGDGSGTGDDAKMVTREPDAGAGAGSCSRYDDRAPNYSGGDSSAALTMGLRPKDDVMGDGNDMSPPSPNGMIIKGRWAPKAKNMEQQLSCPHLNSKHYCHGKCKLCYMKEYNRRTRALKGASAKGRKPGAENDADATTPPAKSESVTNTSTSTSDVGPQGGGAPFAGLSADPASAERVFRRTVSSCEHSDAPHYGKGFCRPCYMREYNKAKRRGEEVVRLPAPPRVLVSYGSRGAKGSSSSVGATGTVTGAAAARATMATTSLLTRGQSSAVPKTAAIPPPLCAECGQTEKSWPLVLICDGCEATFHLGCQGRINQPVGEWFCLRCTEILLDSDSGSEVETGDPENAAGRNTADPASTKACTRSTAPAQRGDAANPGYDTRAAAPETKMSRSDSGEIAKEGLISCADLDGGVDGASSAKGWQVLKAVAAGEAASDSVGEQAAATFRVGAKGHGGRTAAGAKGRCTLKGDVRGCRCPTCVSILLQSGGTRPPEAKKIIVLGEAGHATSVSAPTAVVTGPRKVGSSSATASGASTNSIHVAKRRRQRSSKPSPAPEAVSAAMGRRSSSADGGISGADRAQGARSALYSRVVVRAGSAPVSSANNTSSSSSSTNASVVSASSTSASAANALSTKIQSLRASLGKSPSKDASSAAANASSRGNAAPISDAREELRPSRAKRKRGRDDEEIKWESYNNEGGAEILGARCGKGKGKGGVACSDDGSIFMSSDGASSGGNASEEGGALRGRKRAGRPKKSQVAPDASASAVVHDGVPKGVITACEHTNLPLYSKGLCKKCYMVNYWDRRHAAIGIKPRSPRSSLGPQKKGNKVRAQDLASQNALSSSKSPICASSTTGAAVPVAAAAATDSDGARPEPYGRSFGETRMDIDADSGDGETVDVEGETPEPVSALAVKSEASPGKSTSSGGSGATGKNDDPFGEARNDNGVTHAPTVKCVNEDCQGCHLCSEPGGAVVNDAGINKTVGTRLTGQPVAVKPAASIGGKAVASLVTTAGPKKNGVSHDTEAAAARPSGARISIPKTVIRSMVPGATRPAKPLKKTNPEILSAPLKGPPVRAGQGAGDAQVATKKRPRPPQEGELPDAGTKSVPASRDDAVPVGRGSGGGTGTLLTAVKRVKISAPREQAPVPTRTLAKTPSVSAADGAPKQGET